MTTRRLLVALAALMLLMVSVHAHATARAFLQSDRIALGQTTTLNVEVDSAFGDPPDFSVLAQDFELGQQSSTSRTSIVNGNAQVRSVYAIELAPREAGVITVPALAVGNDTTAPVQLTVLHEEPGSAEAGSPLYLETELSTSEPYVQQAVTYTVRLYFQIPLRNGDLRVRPPENASLQQLGEDRTLRTDVNGIPYNVFERRYLLVPEQSGPLEIPAPQFRGLASTRDMDAFFSRGENVSAIGQRRTIDVRPQPAGAPSPWLPADEVRLARGAVDDTPHAGEPLMLEVTLAADGAMATQLPELELPPIPGAQVFPEPQQRKDAPVGDAPKSSVTRRFAIVPLREGALELPELRVPYWNTKTDKADVARLPPLTLDVAPGTAQPAAPIAPPIGVQPGAPATVDAADGRVDAGPRDGQDPRVWQAIAAAFAVAFVLALLWGWRRGTAPAVPAVATSRQPESLDAAALRRALAGGDLREIADALRASTAPPSTSLETLKARLGDAAQRSALDALERALWAPHVAPAEHEATRARLRAAFKNGPALAKAAVAPNVVVLPPLYPQRKTG